MASLRMRLSLIILSLLFPVPHDSFVIRKRSVNYDFMPSNDLPPSDWILERPRDTLLRDPYAEPYGGGGGDGERQLALELLLEHPEEDYEEDDEDVPEDRMSLIPEDEEDEEVDEDAQVIGGGGGAAAKLVDKSELEDLFEKTTEKKKKMTSPEVDMDLGGSSSSSSKSELTKDDVERLLGPGTTGEMRKVVTETKILVSASNGSDSAPSYEGVRVVEVAEKDSNGATRRQKQTEWLTDPDQEKNNGGGRGEGELPAGCRGWLGDVIGEAEKEEDRERAPTRKVKRSEMSTVEDLVGGGEGGGRSSQEEQEQEEEEREAEDVELLKAYIRLQTEENRHLEKALNLAITTQVEDSDAYLGDEVGQLRMAVENEEELETIRDAIRGRQAQEEEEEDEEEEDNGGRSSSQEEEEEEDGGEEEEEDDNEISRELLKAKLKKFLIDSAVNDISDGGYVDDVDEDEEDEEEETEERGGIPDQYRYGKPTVLNPFTRNALVESRTNKRSPMGIVADLEPDDLSRATNDLDITELLGTPDATELGYCPAVRELTDDCLTARADGLILDAEAVSLCNRHQICYYCGSVFGMTSDSCDGGYLGESEQLCLGEEKCTKEAAGLYLIMAKTHQFIPSPKLAPYVCAAACVYDYVIGLADDRR